MATNGKKTIEEATDQFLSVLAEMHDLSSYFLEALEKDELNGTSELLAVIDVLGKTGSRVYNAVQGIKNAGTPRFSTAKFLKSANEDKAKPQ